MKKIDFTGNFKGLDGKNVKGADGNPIEISSFLANNIVSQKSGDPMRTMTLAKKIYEEKSVSLEKHDIDYLTEIVKKMQFGDILIAELLTRLNK